MLSGLVSRPACNGEHGTASKDGLLGVFHECKVALQFNGSIFHKSASTCNNSDIADVSSSGA